MKTLTFYNYKTYQQDGEDVEQHFLACNVVQTDESDTTVAPFITSQFDSEKTRTIYGWNNHLSLTNNGWWASKKLNKAIQQTTQLSWHKQYAGSYIEYLFDSDDDNFPREESIPHEIVVEGLLEKVVSQVGPNAQIGFLQRGAIWGEESNYSYTNYTVSPICDEVQKLILEKYGGQHD